MSEHRDIRAVIFDIDGTLVDSFSAYWSVFNEGVRRFERKPVSKEALADCLKKGMGLAEIIRRICLPPMKEEEVERCKKEILDLFLTAEEEVVKPFPGVEMVFRSLKEKGLKIGIATGRMSFPEKEWERFGRFGLDKFVGAIVTSREVEGRKPAPDAIIECARRLGVPAGKCLVVGDTELDIVAARRAGAIPIAVTTGQEEEEVLAKAKPESVCNNLNGLFLILGEKGSDEGRMERPTASNLEKR
jgi:HAD superfamily hydrolase (TIGR01509 family)